MDKVLLFEVTTAVGHVQHDLYLLRERQQNRALGEGRGGEGRGEVVI